MNKPVAIHFSNKVKRDLKKYKKTNRKLYEKIDFCIKEILKNPYYGSMKSGDLKGIYSVDIYYSGVNYELAYKIHYDENGDKIIVLLFGTRENFYKELKRYLF